MMKATMIKPTRSNFDTQCRIGTASDLRWIKDLQFRTHGGKCMDLNALKDYVVAPDKELVVATADEVTVGYLLIKMLGPSYRIVDIGIEPHFQHKGIGSILVKPLVSTPFSLSSIVRDTCLPGQLFFRKHGFLCLRIIKGYFVNPSADGYYFWRATQGE